MKNIILFLSIFFYLSPNVKAQKRGIFTDKRDNTTYKTVTINGVIWMNENLKYLPSVCGAGNNCGYFVAEYNGIDINEAKKTENYKTFGVMYQYKVLNDVCPQGWHIPAFTEFRGMIESFSKWNMRLVCYTKTKSPESMGINMQYGGWYADYKKRYLNKNEITRYWTKNGAEATFQKQYLFLTTSSKTVGDNGNYVRCVKGNDTIPGNGSRLHAQSFVSKKNSNNVRNNTKNKSTANSKTASNKQVKETIDYDKLTFNHKIYGHEHGYYTGYSVAFPQKPIFKRIDEIEELYTYTYGDAIFRVQSAKLKYRYITDPDIENGIDDAIKEFKKKYITQKTTKLYNKKGYRLTGKRNGKTIEHIGFFIDYPEKKQYFFITMEVESGKTGVPIRNLLDRFSSTFRTFDKKKSDYIHR